MGIDVVTFGEAMCLLVADRPGPLELVQAFTRRTAGAETNVAIGLARLGLNVAWCSRLGNDSMGRFLLEAVRREGVDCSHVVVDAMQSTGFMLKGSVTDGGDPPIEYHRKGSAASQMFPEQVDVPWISGARHLHATGIFPALSKNCLATAIESMEVMRNAGRTISFDPNLRPSLWRDLETMRDAVNDLAFRADWVLPGLEEGRILTGRNTPEEIANFYLNVGVRLVVIKLGAAGAYFASSEGFGHVPGFAVSQVVDTVGAGDGFAVGVISGLLEGMPVLGAVTRGTWIGARAVQVVGDTEGLPTRAQLRDALL